MQYAASVQEDVLRNDDIRDKVVANIDVSHKGFAAMSNLLTLQKKSSAFVSQQMQTDPWVLYLQGVEFVSSQRGRVNVYSVTPRDWERIFEALHTYESIQDVIADILDHIAKFRENNAYKQKYGNMIRLHSNDENRAMLTRILENFAGIHRIEAVAFAVLSDMYKAFRTVSVVATSYDKPL